MIFTSLCTAIRLFVLSTFAHSTVITLGSVQHHNSSVLSDILVLNLDRRPDRWNNISRILKDVGLPFTRFPAVDGMLAQRRQFEMLHMHDGVKFSWEGWVGGGQHSRGDYGVTGCWLTHMAAYFEISDRVRKSGMKDDPVMILEDDVYLSQNATYLVNQGAAFLPNDWEVFFVGFKNDYCFYYLSPYLCRGSMLLDAHAYIIRNASVAEKLIHYSNQQSPQVADIYWIPLFKDTLKIYLLRPAEVFRQNKAFGTDLQIPAADKPENLPTSSPATHATNSSSTSTLAALGDLSKMEHLVALQRILSSMESESAIGYLPSPKDTRGMQLGFDYTNILEFFMRAFIENRYERYIGHAPVLIFELDFHSSQLGNRLGNYFEALSFARKNGLHFVAFGLFSRDQDNRTETSGGGFLKFSHPFVKALPTVLLHPHPIADRDKVAKMLNSTEGEVFLRPWPWGKSKPETFWLDKDNLAFIAQTMHDAVINQLVESHRDIFASFNSGHFTEKQLEKITLPASTFFSHHPHHHQPLEPQPLIPSAVILFRCNDILLHGGDEYGFLNFHTYPPLIPQNSREIYIIGEPLHYGQWSSSCLNITQALVDFLKQRYINTTVLVRRGYVFDGLSQLTLTKTVVCAPSTFCFWAAIANKNVNVHYANSPLISKGSTPELTGNFHWITSPKVMGFWQQKHYDLRDRNATDFIISKLTNKSMDAYPVYLRRRK